MKSMGMSLMCAKVEVTDWVTKSSGKGAKAEWMSEGR